MRVQHNIAAMNSYRNYNNNTSAINKNLEKLSSGYKINRAGDDAAGLAISEKMRAQITGLAGAQKNAKDGISLVQTAEGALTEVHSMLNRMYELSEESANGTFEGIDREQLQKEVDQLREEINRIADSSNFNGLNLLDGSLSASGSSGSSKTVTADLSKLGVDALANATTYKAVKGEYQTGKLLVTATKASATSVTLTQGDVFEFTVNYTDGNGEEKTSTLRIKVAECAKSSAAYKQKSFVIDDGSENGIQLVMSTARASKGKLTHEEMVQVIKKAIEKQPDGAIKSAFTVATGTAATGGLKFTAKAGGSEGAVLTGYSLTKIPKTTDENDPYPTTSYNQTKVTKFSSVVNVTKVAMDAGKAYDLKSNSLIWDNQDDATASSTWKYAKKLDDAIFEVNGKKFVFVNKTMSDGDLEALRNAGVDEWVKVSGATSISSKDVGKMAEKIQKQTGLDLILATVSATNTVTVKSRTTWTSAGGKWIIFGDGANTAKGKSGGLTLQIGDTAADYNQLHVDISDVHVKALGIADIDISVQDKAQDAMDKIKAAINDVSSTRGTLGATQNRLEHTINNLSVMQENIQDAEATVRDTDVADEMMKYTKNSILVQSAQAMLAQANQQPQGVLQLLQ